MRGRLGKTVLALVGLAALSACDGEPQLMNIRTDAPDEFAVLPTKPLEAPEDYTSLPDPTPGGTNLADPTPQADAIAALGGNPDRLTDGRIYAGEQTLISYTSRYGVPADIRATLAAEDLAWREENNGLLLERLFNVNVYFDSYKPMSLDQHIELDRLRARGIWTPSAPPDPQIAVE
ncbi:DUF3035 domain-containing protein [Sinisalibacter aestuarii]|uniref:DUF3035 domain-containing protein n=1 Tax=Sinisalibacter aestuarii TaxID=2949426 RepID=A0ABQ5LPB4_9RHOB|nr:DUF3035 domain-containing protein [Sinisalibacter aestuarii]GKY86784.1 hypothetical protein STA1M1_06530 [Sinisalibacter aestuarii]